MSDNIINSDDFVETLLGSAQKQSLQILEESKQYQHNELKKSAEITNQKIKRYYDKEMRKIKAAAASELAAAEFELKKQLYSERSAITERVFSRVCEKINNYTKTDEYRVSIIKKAVDILSADKDVKFTLYVRTDDMKLFETIPAEILSNGEIQADSSIALGGFRIYYAEKNTELDCTYDSMLKEERSRFTETCGLKVV